MFIAFVEFDIDSQGLSSSWFSPLHSLFVVTA
jgi:hypothetical protein